jgi:molecular chaperone DnaK
VAAIEGAMKGLNDAWAAASEDISKASQDAGGSAPNEGATESKGEDVTDVEYEEVDDKK